MGRPVVVFDIDGVLADFTYAFSTLTEGVGHTPGAQQTWKFTGPSKDINKAWRMIDASSDWWRKLNLLPTQSEVEEMRTLAKRVDIVYMTGRQDKGNDVKGQTEKWLLGYGLPHGEVMLENDKVRGCDIVEVTQRDIIGIIDDKPETVADLTAAGFNAYVRDWPYNRAVGLRIPRVSSVGEFVHQMMRLL